MVTVFYEALCPDSKHFVIKQLQAAFYKAPTLIDFQLIPYGKATVFNKPILDYHSSSNQLFVVDCFRPLQTATVH